MAKEIKGILSALPTPFAEDGSIDEKLLRRVVDRNVNAGINVLVAGGGTGEFMSLSTAERKRVYEVVADQAAGRVPVVAHTGAITTAEAVELTAAAKEAGADVIMLVSPYYEPLSKKELDLYIKTVVESTDLPVMLYNNPGTTGISYTAAELAAYGRQYENVKYVKDSSKDWEQALRLIYLYKDDISLICGWDSFSFSAFLEGAVGVMAGAANVVPDEIAAVYQAIESGDIVGAKKLWEKLFPVLDTMVDLPFTQAVKAGMRLRGEPIGSVRQPLLDLEPEDEEKLAKALEALTA